MQIDGGCHCGKITYRADIDPERVVICHCSDCQVLSGSAFRMAAFTSEDGFELVTGEIKTYVKTADSGRQRVQGFCAECGTGIYATAPGDGPKVYGIRVGTIRQRGQLPPRRQIWCDSAQAWLGDIATLPRVARQP
jgi:hypothetical protein